MQRTLAIFIIVFACIAAYSNSLHGQFIWDDHNFIKNNITIRSLSNLPDIFRSSIALGSFHSYYYYRPIQELTYMIDYQLWHLNVVGFHITNIFIHILVSLCVFWLISMLSGGIAIAFASSLFFAIHPVQVESVTYLSDRGDILSTLFILVAIILYIKSCCSQNKLLYIGVFFAFILALFTKENSFVFPLLIAAYHYSYNKPFNKANIITILFSIVIYFVVRTTMVSGLGSLFSELSGASERIPGFFSAFAKYLAVIFVPYPLHYAYGQKIFSFTSPSVLFGFIAFLIILLLPFIIKRQKKSPLITFSIWWFIISLLPYSNIYKIYSYYADHHIYMASIGAFAMIGCFWNYLLRQKKFLALKKIVLALIVTILCCITIMQNNYWIDPIVFHETTLKYVPKNTSSRTNLAGLYLERGDIDKAAYHYKEAIRISPNSTAKAHNGLGIVFFKSGKPEQAIELFKKSIRIEPEYAITWNNLGLVYLDLKYYEKAINVLRHAVELNDMNYKGYYHLGLAHYLTERYDLAEDAFLKAISIDPEHKKAYFHLALIAKREGDRQKSKAILKKGFRDRDEFSQAYKELNNL